MTVIPIPIEWIPPLIVAIAGAGAFFVLTTNTRKALSRSFKRIERVEGIVLVNIGNGKLDLPTGFDLSPGDE